MKMVSKLIAPILTITLAGPALAQTPSDMQKANASSPSKSSTDAPATRPNPDTFPERTFYLNVSDQNAQNEIVTALRNTVSPNDKVILVWSQNAIVMRAGPEDMALAQTILSDLDRPRKNYRLTYTVSEMDENKKIGTQHYSMILAQGQETSLNLGSKFPIVTEMGTSASQTQFTYLDLGMNFDATLTGMANGAMLKSSVEDSSVAPEKTVIGNQQEPIVRRTSLKGESFLIPGKSVMLGSMDIPGSPSRLDIEVVMEQLP
jgi:type II secretory pathway component GspD/PulD (secretin)